MIRSILVVLVMLTVAQTLNAQRRAGADPEKREAADIGILVTVGGTDYRSRVAGTCKHEPSASVHGVSAALWMVQANGSAASEIRHLSLTLWQPKDGSADQLSLALDAGSKPVAIEINPREQARGAATVQVHRSDAGGKLEVKGKDASGAAVSMTISCPVFAAVTAEGG